MAAWLPLKTGPLKVLSVSCKLLFPKAAMPLQEFVERGAAKEGVASSPQRMVDGTPCRAGSLDSPSLDVRPSASAIAVFVRPVKD